LGRKGILGPLPTLTAPAARPNDPIKSSLAVYLTTICSCRIGLFKGSVCPNPTFSKPQVPFGFLPDHQFSTGISYVPNSFHEVEAVESKPGDCRELKISIPRFGAHSVLHQSALAGTKVKGEDVETRTLKFWPFPFPEESPTLMSNVDHFPSSPSKTPLGGTTCGRCGSSIVGALSARFWENMVADGASRVREKEEGTKQRR
jgi:hypothetical protein